MKLETCLILGNWKNVTQHPHFEQQISKQVSTSHVYNTSIKQ